jgi:hypothetical protein
VLWVAGSASAGSASDWEQDPLGGVVRAARVAFWLAWRHPRQGHDWAWGTPVPGRGQLCRRLGPLSGTLTKCQDGRERHLGFHFYDQLEPPPGIGDLLREIDRDPIAIFWG